VCTLKKTGFSGLKKAALVCLDMKKSSKRFLVSSEEKNSQGFRVRTAGIRLGQYEKNPLLLWMHKRPKGDSTEEILPLGNGVDMVIENGNLYGVPLFDPSDAFALKIHNKVENGTIRMASAGLHPISWKEDENGELWLWDSELVEWSLCDIGANPEALAVSLYNADGELVTLSQLNQEYETD
jgi:hypothetical protein